MSKVITKNEYLKKNKYMKKYFCLLVMSLLVFTVLSANTKKFYGSKSWIIGVSGDISELVSEGLEAKFFVNDVKFEVQRNHRTKKFKKSEREQILYELNKKNVGKKFLDYLFCYNGDSLSETLLKERALKSVQLIDEERAKIGVIDNKTILQENYLPILEHNYIVMTRKKEKKTYWIVLRVGIDKNILEEVFNSWNDMDKYNVIKVPIEYVASGSYKNRTNFEVRNRLAREIAEKVAAFGIRGQITDNHPLTVNIGDKEGVLQGDRFAIYRQFANDEGENRSKRIAYARAGKVTESTRLFAMSGKASSYKKGDIGVLDLDRGIGGSITGNLISIKDYADYWGTTYNSDYRVHFSKKGISTYALFSLGLYASEEDIENTSAIEIDKGVEYDSTPTLMDIGLGIGWSKTFLGRMELMPYIKAHYMFALGEPDDYENFTKLIRVPVGIRANINLFYPFQLTCGMEYSLLTLEADSENDFGDSDMLNSFGAYIGFRLIF